MKRQESLSNRWNGLKRRCCAYNGAVFNHVRRGSGSFEHGWRLRVCLLSGKVGKRKPKYIAYYSIIYVWNLKNDTDKPVSRMQNLNLV